MLTSVDHAMIAVRDLEAATETYAKLFGRRPSWRGEHPGLGTANALFRLDNSYVELVAPATDGALADELRVVLEMRGEGPVGLAFGTEDVRAVVSALAEKGWDVPAPADGRGREAASGRERRWRSVRLPLDRTRGVVVLVIEHAAGELPAAELTAAPQAAVGGVDHFVVMTPDADAAKAVYGDGLGLRLALDRTSESRKLRLLFFRLAGITVEIAAPQPSSGEGADRFWGISYRVSDVAAARERVAAAGFDVSEVRAGMKPGTRVCTVRSNTHGVATLLLGPE
jgi:catechol 2,3-dioxygenase-like lactoylglutathione lyase family enzyme